MQNEVHELFGSRPGRVTLSGDPEVNPGRTGNLFQHKPLAHRGFREESTMKTRIAALAAALTVTAAVATATPASADPVPGNPNQFYAYCAVDLLGVPLGCTETDVAHASHVCQYVATGVGLGLDCIQR
jgi:hypothetical protein